MLHLKSPYSTDVAPENPFIAAPWGLVLLILLALLPIDLGRTFLFAISLISFAYSAKKLGANLMAITAFLLSPPVVYCLLRANIEWIPLLGFVLPARIGIFFILVKPQTGFALGIFWFIEAWRNGGWREVCYKFWPVTIVILVSFILFGFWPLNALHILGIAQDFNASLWPISIPFGIVLICLSLFKREAKFAIAASPFLSPYVLFYSWISAIVALSARTLIMISTVFGLWLYAIIRMV